jgi:hypothetical protein
MASALVGCSDIVLVCLWLSGLISLPDDFFVCWNDVWKSIPVIACVTTALDLNGR